MTEASLLISVGALLVSVIALLRGWSADRTQSRLVFEQQRNEVRLDTHEFAMQAQMMVDQAVQILINKDSMPIVRVTDTLMGITLAAKDIHRRLAKLSEPRAKDAADVNAELLSMKADLQEDLRTLDMCDGLLKTGQIDRLEEELSKLLKRFGGQEK